MNVLHICANPKPTEESVSKQLSVAFISTLIEKNPDVEINNVDLYQEPPPFLNYAGFRGLWMPVFDPGYKLTREETRATEYSDRQAALFNQADVLVLTMPMWNFGPPAIMKAWLDQVLAPGRTFDFGPEGVKPRHHVRTVVLLVASGGEYKESDPRDALTPDIRSAFEFVGITDLRVAWADGQTAMFFGDHAERKQTALDAAAEAAEEVIEDLSAATAG